jgi:hypothetical protein
MTSKASKTKAWLYLLIPVSLFLIFALWFSNSTGASFQTTLRTVLETAAVLALVIAASYFIHMNLLVISTVFLAISWPFWWKVLDGIDDAWYAARWFQYFAEAVLIGLAAYAIYKNFHKRYVRRSTEKI